MITVDMPDGSTIDFPDGTSHDTITGVLSGSYKPNAGQQARNLAKQYGPFVGTGLGEDAAIGLAGLANKTHIARVANAFGYPGLGTPETYQHAAETVTGEWPQPKTREERLAKYAGNALPFLAAVPAATNAYLSLPTLAQFGIPGAGYYFRKQLRGILPW